MRNPWVALWCGRDSRRGTASTRPVRRLQRPRGPAGLAAVLGLALDPAGDHVDDVLALGFVELAALVDAMALAQAGPAAGGGRVLGPEHRVTAPRRLLSVVARRGRGQPPVDEVAGVLAHGLHPAQLDERALVGAQVELRPERVLGDLVEASVEVGGREGHRPEASQNDRGSRQGLRWGSEPAACRLPTTAVRLLPTAVWQL